MFEEEAEEYKDNTRIKDKNTYIGFPDERISEVQDYEGNYIDISERIIKTSKDGAEFGYNKANEWHYMKDGDLPKVNELVLIKITGCFVLGWTNGTNWFNDSNNGSIIDRRMVYAWKEIVLPKEIKEK